VIPAIAVDTALRGIGEHAFIEGRLADSFRDVVGFGERIACGLALDEFYSEQQAEAANIAYVGMYQ